MKTSTKTGESVVVRSVGGFEVPVFCEHERLEPVLKVKPNPKNPVFHPESQIKALAKIIRANGFRSPVTISSLSGMVVAGHGRLKAAEYLGLDCVPIDIQHFASEREEWEHLLADNRIAELKETDKRMLAEIIDTKLDKDSAEASGFTQDEFLSLVKCELAKKPEAQAEKPGSKKRELSPEEKAAQEEARQVKQIVLVYLAHEQAAVLRDIDTVGQKYGTKNASVIVQRALRSIAEQAEAAAAEAAEFK